MAGNGAGAHDDKNGISSAQRYISGGGRQPELGIALSPQRPFPDAFKRPSWRMGLPIGDGKNIAKEAEGQGTRPQPRIKPPDDEAWG